MPLAAINLLDPFNLTLITIVAVFWALVVRKAILAGRKWFPNLAIIPIFFIGVGLLINQVRAGWGTYAVGALHLLLLGLLAVNMASRRRG